MSFLKRKEQSDISTKVFTVGQEVWIGLISTYRIGHGRVCEIRADVGGGHYQSGTAEAHSISGTFDFTDYEIEYFHTGGYIFRDTAEEARDDVINKLANSIFNLSERSATYSGFLDK